MNNELITPLIDGYIDGTLSPEEEKLVEDYLAGHPEMRRRVQEESGLREMLGKWPGYDPGEDYWLDLENRINAATSSRARPAAAAEQKQKKRSAGALNYIIPLAASFVIFLGSIHFISPISETRLAERESRNKKEITAEFGGAPMAKIRIQTEILGALTSGPPGSVVNRLLAVQQLLGYRSGGGQ